MKNEYIPFTIEKQKRIALIAHDGKKSELVAWCKKNKKSFSSIFCAEPGQQQD